MSNAGTLRVIFSRWIVRSIGFRSWGVACFATVAGLAQASLQDKPVKEKDQASEQKQASDREKNERMELMKKAAAEYEIYLGSDRQDKLSLRAEPILRWSNPVRVTQDGSVFEIGRAHV